MHFRPYAPAGGTGSVSASVHSQHGPSDVATIGLLLLSAVHTAYWWDPWRRGQRHAAAAVAGMVVTNFVLLNLLGVPEPLLWLYPALVAGAGLLTPVAVMAIGLTALAAAGEPPQRQSGPGRGCRAVRCPTPCASSRPRRAGRGDCHRRSKRAMSIEIWRPAGRQSISHHALPQVIQPRPRLSRNSVVFMRVSSSISSSTGRRTCQGSRWQQP
jgi:hypothetical protein